MRHDGAHVLRHELVEGDPATLGQDLAKLHVIALASSLLLGLARIAVVDLRAGRIRFHRPLKGVRVSELGAVVGEDGPEEALEEAMPENAFQHVERSGHCARRLFGEQQAELRLRRAQIERQYALGVALPADHGVHLASAVPLVLGERAERRVGALRPMGGDPALLVLLAGLVSHFAPQLGVGHAPIARCDPAIDRGGADVELVLPPIGDLGWRQAVADVGADLAHGRLEVELAGVDASARQREELLGERLRAGGGVFASPLLGAVAVPQLAPVAHPRPALQPRACVLRRLVDPLSFAGPFGHHPVALHFLGDGGGRAAQVLRHGPGDRPLRLERPLDGRALGSSDPEVPLGLLLRHDAFLSLWDRPPRSILRKGILGLSWMRAAEF